MNDVDRLTPLLVLLLVACGDDGAGDSSAAHGSSSTGGGGAPASSVVTSGAGGQGGEGAGTSSASAGGGGAAPSAIGGPCLADDDCAEGICLTEGVAGDPSGFCSRRCDPSAPDGDCPEGVCESRGAYGLVCMPSCDPEAPACREAYQCRPAGQTSTDWACRADCAGPADCPTTRNCVESTAGGRCIFPESDCDDLRDQDQDRAVDCSDPHCSEDPACAGGPGALGAPCASHLDCAPGTFCVDEARAGWPRGTCAAGRGEDGLCAEGQTSFTVYTMAPDILDVSGCLLTCASDDDCRDGYRCQGWCRPRCTEDAHCGSGNCRADFDWLCAPPEVCDDGLDNDGFQGTDCADPACTALCADAFATSCAEAAPLQPSGTFTSSEGQHSVCSGPGASLDFYTFTPPDSGVMTVRLEAATPHHLGVFSDDCDPDPFLCVDNFTPFTDGVEERSFSLDAGRVVLVSVAAASAADVGPYALEYTFSP